MLRSLGRMMGRRPSAVIVILFLALAGIGGGGYAYALGLWRAAAVAVKEGRFAEANRHLRLFLFLWPRSVEVHVLAARMARIHGNFTGAEAHLNQALKLSTGTTEAVELEFLLMRVQMGEADAVAPALVNCVENGHPETPLILETLARGYMNNLRYRPAFSILNRWIKAEPEAAVPFFLRAWVLERMDGRAEAMKDYARAGELDPDLIPARLRLAEMFLEKSNPREAEPHLEELYRRHPDRGDVMARLGQCRLLQGRLDEARPLLEAAVERQPDDPTLLIHLAKLELHQGHPVQAETWLRQVLKGDPSDTEAQYVLISSLQLQNRQKEAAVLLAQYQKDRELVLQANKLLQEEAVHPSSRPEIPARAGTMLLQLGQERLGLYWLHQALERDPGYRPARQALAEYYEKKGDSERAATYLRRPAKQQTASP